MGRKVVTSTPSPAKKAKQQRSGSAMRKKRLEELKFEALVNGITDLKKPTKGEQEVSASTKRITGDGTTANPIRQALRTVPNKSNCFHCMKENCDCHMFENILGDLYDTIPTKRITEVAGHKNLCAKSILPVFVSRMIDILSITSKDTFYDLGCGNGSVMFQVAYVTGAPCIGIEICPHNAELARQAWKILKPQLEKISGRKMPEVTIITGDIGEFLSDEPTFGKTGNTVIWTANLLMPKSLTSFMAERFRTLPVGSRIMCFDDLYPHSRSVARIRDPEAFELFEMLDYEWPVGSVEWCYQEGSFYVHKRQPAEKTQ